MTTASPPDPRSSFFTRLGLVRPAVPWSLAPALMLASLGVYLVGTLPAFFTIAPPAPDAV